MISLKSCEGPCSPTQLMVENWPLALTALVTLSTLGYVVYQLYLSPLSRFPGPFLAKLTDFWRAHLVLYGMQHETLMELHRKHGPVVRIGPSELSVTDPVAFKEIYRVSKPFYKSAYYEAFHNGREFDIFAERDEKKHGQNRRIFSRPYSSAGIKDFEADLDDVLMNFVNALKSMDGQDVDFGKYLELFAFDFITQASFSRHFNYVGKGTDNGVFKSIRTLTKFATFFGQVPWLFHATKPITAFMGRFSALDESSRVIGGLLVAALQERNANLEKAGGNGENQPDIYGKLFQARKSSSVPTDEQILQGMGANIVAGVGDVSIFLNALFYYLVCNPDKLEKLVEELRQRKVAGLLSDVVRSEEANACPYLQAVIYETLRLHSPAPGLLQRTVPKGGMLIKGQHIPEGVTVGTAAWTIHREPGIWGSDPDEYRPERWLDEERKTEMHKYFFAFGGGTRTCIGRNFSWMEANKLLPTLLLHLDLKRSEKVPDWTVTCKGSVHQDDLFIKVIAREL